VSTADAHPRCDYIGYCSADGRPAILSRLGVFAEWCAGDALRRAHREAMSAADREHVTPYLYAHPELFNVRLIPLPLELEREDLRLWIDSEEDWEHAQAVVDSLGHEEWDWRRLARLMHKRPSHAKRAGQLDRARSKS
jgi:spore coat polysaccharide biosynthesis protein SpsF